MDADYFIIHSKINPRPSASIFIRGSGLEEGVDLRDELVFRGGAHDLIRQLPVLEEEHRRVLRMPN